MRRGRFPGRIFRLPKEILLVHKVCCSLWPKPGGYICSQHGNAAVLFDIANGSLHACLHSVVVCHHRLEDYMILDAIFHHVIAHQFLCTVHSQIPRPFSCSIHISARRLTGLCRLLVLKFARYSVSLSTMSRKCVRQFYPMSTPLPSQFASRCLLVSNSARHLQLCPIV